MDSKYERANSWSNIVIGSAIEVHRLKGPGIYEKCLGRELQLRDVPVIGQVEVALENDEKPLGKSDLYCSLSP